MMTNYNQTTSTGLPAPLLRVGAYVLGWISGIIVLLIEQKNQDVRHHARQSIYVFGALSILGLLLGLFGGFFGAFPFIGGVLAFPFRALDFFVWPLTLLLWVVFMVVGLLNIRTPSLPGQSRVNKLLS